nr:MULTISPECIES: transposase [Streptomyces]
MREGAISSTLLLRRLRAGSRRNATHTMFREVGRVIRTVQLLRFLSAAPLRRRVTAATNKVEAFNGFSQWIGFGNGGVITDNDPVEQEKTAKFHALLTNAVFSELACPGLALPRSGRQSASADRACRGTGPGVGDGGDAEVDDAAIEGAPVELGEFLRSPGEADLESFDFAEPAFTFGFGDAGEEVVADLDEPVALGGVGPEHGAANTGFSELGAGLSQASDS